MLLSIGQLVGNVALINCLLNCVPA